MGLSIPALALGATGLILALIIVAQAAGAAVWLPVVRRVVGHFGPARPSDPRTG
jgi:hypothetical protein